MTNKNLIKFNEQLMNENNRLREEVKKNKNLYLNMQRDYIFEANFNKGLSEKFSKLQKDYEELKADYEELKADYDSLEEEYDELDKKLVETYDELEKKLVETYERKD